MQVDQKPSSQYQIEECPILYPTAKEFANFQDYVNMIEKKYFEYGIVKVVPPKKWRPNDYKYQEILDRIKIPGPIEQNTYGKGGIYELLFIQRKTVTLAEYQKKAEVFNQITEGKTVEQVEKEFWKTINFSPPLYGADFMDSLMQQGIPWNLAELKTFLSEGLPEKISGVTYPYLYVGCWKSMFGWHKEDLDLNAINFLHFGKNKLWYCIPVDETQKLENFARLHFSDGFSKCSEYLRHKTIMISPYVLKQRYKGNIKIYKAVQKPNEFIITTAGAYHSGFNFGYNLAEAVNFGSLGWLDRFYTSHICKCQRDSVHIDKPSFLEYLLSTKYRNEPEVLKFKRQIEEEEVKLLEKEQQRLLKKSKSHKGSHKHQAKKSLSPVSAQFAEIEKELVQINNEYEDEEEDYEEEEDEEDQPQKKSKKNVISLKKTITKGKKSPSSKSSKIRASKRNIKKPTRFQM